MAADYFDHIVAPAESGDAGAYLAGRGNVLRRAGVLQLVGRSAKQLNLIARDLLDLGESVIPHWVLPVAYRLLVRRWLTFAAWQHWFWPGENVRPPQLLELLFPAPPQVAPRREEKTGHRLGKPHVRQHKRALQAGQRENLPPWLAMTAPFSACNSPATFAVRTSRARLSSAARPPASQERPWYPQCLRLTYGLRRTGGRNGW